MYSMIERYCIYYGAVPKHLGLFFLFSPTVNSNEVRCKHSSVFSWKQEYSCVALQDVDENPTMCL